MDALSFLWFSVFVFALFKTIHLPPECTPSRRRSRSQSDRDGRWTADECVSDRSHRRPRRRSSRRARWSDDRNFQTLTEYFGGTPAHDWFITAAYLSVVALIGVSLYKTPAAPVALTGDADHAAP